MDTKDACWLSSRRAVGWVGFASLNARVLSEEDNALSENDSETEHAKQSRRKMLLLS